MDRLDLRDLSVFQVRLRITDKHLVNVLSLKVPLCLYLDFVAVDALTIEDPWSLVQNRQD